MDTEKIRDAINTIDHARRAKIWLEGCGAALVERRGISFEMTVRTGSNDPGFTSADQYVTHLLNEGAADTIRGAIALAETDESRATALISEQIRQDIDSGADKSPDERRSAADADKYSTLAPGLYLIEWEDSSNSYAAVGMGEDGTRWLAPTNWIAPRLSPDEYWRKIVKATPV